MCFLYENMEEVRPQEGLTHPVEIFNSSMNPEISDAYTGILSMKRQNVLLIGLSLELARHRHESKVKELESAYFGRPFWGSGDLRTMDSFELTTFFNLRDNNITELAQIKKQVKFFEKEFEDAQKFEKNCSDKLIQLGVIRPN